MSDQVKADTINGLLPMAVSKEDIKNNPEFAKLLLQLSKHIRPDGITHARAKELKIAKAKLESQKAEYLNAQTLNSAVDEVILSHQVKQLHVSSSRESPISKSINQLDKLRTVAEIGAYFVPYMREDGSSDRLLNLASSPSNSEVTSKLLWQAAEHVKPLVEQHLDKMTGQLVDLVQAAHPEGGVTVEKLPSILANWKCELEENRKRLDQDVRKTEQNLWRYYEALIQRWEILGKMIEFVDKEEVYNSSQVAHSIKVNDTFELKGRVKEVNVLCDTYDKETIEALRELRRVLSQELKDASDHTAEVKSQLQSYEAAGPEFNALVKQYTALQKQLHSKKWLLNEMQSHDDE